MKRRSSDRRNANRDIAFPFTDLTGNYVGADRRSGLDRRNFESDEIVLKIVSLINH